MKRPLESTRRTSLARLPHGLAGRDKLLRAKEKPRPAAWSAPWPPHGTLLRRIHDICAKDNTTVDLSRNPDNVDAFLRYVANRNEKSRHIEELVRELGLERDLLACEVLET